LHIVALLSEFDIPDHDPTCNVTIFVAWTRKVMKPNTAPNILHHGMDDSIIYGQTKETRRSDRNQKCATKQISENSWTELHKYENVPTLLRKAKENRPKICFTCKQYGNGFMRLVVKNKLHTAVDFILQW